METPRQILIAKPSIRKLGSSSELVMITITIIMVIIMMIIMIIMIIIIMIIIIILTLLALIKIRAYYRSKAV